MWRSFLSIWHIIGTILKITSAVNREQIRGGIFTFWNSLGKSSLKLQRLSTDIVLFCFIMFSALYLMVYLVLCFINAVICYLMVFCNVQVKTEAHECFTKIGQFYPPTPHRSAILTISHLMQIMLLLLVLRINDQRAKLMKVATSWCCFIPGR